MKRIVGKFGWAWHAEEIPGGGRENVKETVGELMNEED